AAEDLDRQGAEVRAAGARMVGAREAHPLVREENFMDLDLTIVDRLLTTARSVRKRLDLRRPVDPALVERAIEVAVQAPTGSNSQGWHFVVVTDATKRARIGELYRRAFEAYVNMPNAFRDALAPDDPRAQQLPRIVDSAMYLAQHLQQVPAHVTYWNAWSTRREDGTRGE